MGAETNKLRMLITVGILAIQSQNYFGYLPIFG
jgi:hypothetical protein